MQALIFDRPGEPLDVLRLTKLPSPRPQSGEALVNVAARPIHPADLAFIRGRYCLQPSLPQVAGLEGAGDIAEAPHGSEFEAGERVAFRWPGSWAGLAAVPVDRLTKVPADIGRDSLPDFAQSAHGLGVAGSRRDASRGRGHRHGRHLDRGQSGYGDLSRPRRSNDRYRPRRPGERSRAHKGRPSAARR